MAFTLSDVYQAITGARRYNSEVAQAAVRAAEAFLKLCQDNGVEPDQAQMAIVMNALVASSNTPSYAKQAVDQLKALTLSQDLYFKQHYERYQGTLSQIDKKDASERELFSDESKVSERTRKQMAQPAPLANEKVDTMDVSNYEKMDRLDVGPDDEYKGHFSVNNQLFMLWNQKTGNLKGVTRSDPIYDEKALTTMYDENYFGDKATLQVGIPDRGEEEVVRRQKISEMQVNEWAAAGIPAEGQRVVEIGGGSAYLSAEVQKRGGDVLNVELSKERCDACEERGIKTYNGFLQNGVANDDRALGYKSADVVACYDLLEHIVNPDQGFIQAVNAILKTGGHFCLRIPEGTDPSLHLIDHVNHFSFESLKEFLGKFGFEYHARPDDKRYSGTFSEPEHAKTIHKYDDKGNLKADDTVNKPMARRTIENMTVYFTKVRDCDYTVLQNYRTQPKNPHRDKGISN